MAGGAFKQEEIAQMFVQVMARLVKLERQLGIAARTQEVEAAEPNDDSFSGEFSRGFRYTVRCSTPDEDHHCFMGRIMVPTDSTSKWTTSNTFTAMMTVDVPDGLDVPEQDAIISVFFDAPYAVGKSRYVLAGAGGGKLFQCRVESRFGDYLAVISIASGTTAGSIFSAVHPYYLRQTPWNGITIDGVTRTYSTNFTRIASSATFSQLERVVPDYNLGTDLIFVSAIDHSDIAVGGEEVKFIDVNVDGRAWASSE